MSRDVQVPPVSGGDATPPLSPWFKRLKIISISTTLPSIVALITPGLLGSIVGLTTNVYTLCYIKPNMLGGLDQPVMNIGLLHAGSSALHLVGLIASIFGLAAARANVYQACQDLGYETWEACLEEDSSSAPAARFLAIISLMAPIINGVLTGLRAVAAVFAYKLREDIKFRGPPGATSQEV